MKLYVDQILEEGVSVVAETDKDGWLRQLFERAMGDSILAGDYLKLDMLANLIGAQVACVGNFQYKIHPTCARCGAVFESEDRVQLIHHYIAGEEAQMSRKKKSHVEEINVAEDEDFSIYEGKTIDLDPMLYEHLLLSQPTIYLCDEDCKGLCGQCAKNLNEGPCGCAPIVAPHPFDALKALKITKK